MKETKKGVREFSTMKQLREFLMPSEKYISLEEFRKEVEKKWPRESEKIKNQ